MIEPSPLSELTLGMLSWNAPATLEATLASYEGERILDLFPAKVIHFNEISAEDRRIANRYGLTVLGCAENIGIFGGVDAIVQQVRTPFLLYLENDCPLVTDRSGFLAMASSALEDMRNLNVPVFQMRSRREPGEVFSRRDRYEAKFQPVWPLGSDESQRRPLPNVLRRGYENMRRSALRGCAIYAEEDPAVRHPGVIEKSPNGNWLTTSAFLNWSNNGVMARTDFIRDVILDHVRKHPAKSTLNGHQDIEAALKADNWWRKQAFAMGQSEPGAFTHVRLDR